MAVSNSAGCKYGVRGERNNGLIMPRVSKHLILRSKKKKSPTHFCAKHLYGVRECAKSGHSAMKCSVLWANSKQPKDGCEWNIAILSKTPFWDGAGRGVSALECFGNFSVRWLTLTLLQWRIFLQ